MKARLLAVLPCLAVVVLSPVVTLAPIPAAAAVQSAGAWQLGTLTITGGSSTQENFTVSCPEMRSPLGGTLWISPAQGRPKGLVVGLSGGYGVVRFVEGFSMDSSWLNTVTSAGYEFVQVQWARPGWEPSQPGEVAGPAHAACRPATAVSWIYDNLYSQLHLNRHGVGACGFCIAGESGGASEVSYILAYYGLAPILDAAFSVSGPPHGAIAKGCLNVPGYAYQALPNGAMALALMDSSFGYFNGSGPCTNHLSSFTSHWNNESPDIGGNSYVYPTTRVQFILGGYDSQVIIHHSSDFVSRLVGAGSPMVYETTVPGMAHDVMSSANGLATLLTAIEAGGIPGSVTTPVASPQAGRSPTPPTSTSPGLSPAATTAPTSQLAGIVTNNPLGLATFVAGVAVLLLLGAWVIASRSSGARRYALTAWSTLARAWPRRKR